MKLAIPVNEHDHVIGPTNASVTIVNYGDYLCPACPRRHREVERIVNELLNSVRFVYRHFPLVNVHPHALRAAEAAEAAAAQGKFWEMHRLLYSRSAKLGDRDLRRHAREIGLDLDRFDREMASGTYADQIMKDRYNSIINGITGAPTTFINGVLYAMSGVELLSTVKAILEDHSSPRVNLQNGNNRSGPVRKSILPWKRYPSIS
jgi:protein-disulfide isomerase